MGKKILKTLTNNFGFKLLAVFLGFILWVVVYNIDDPSKTSNFTVNVSVINADTLTDQNLCYEVIEGTGSVTFSVTAPRSIVDKLEDTDFTATADMNRMVLDEENATATIPIDITSSRYISSLTFNAKNKYIKVALEDLMTKQFIIGADTTGKVAEGFALGEVSVTNPNVLKVSGPASLVKEISNVVASIDVGNMSQTIVDKVVPVLYDAEGKEIDTTRLELSNSTVTITAKILATKSVALSFTTSGEPAENFIVQGIVCTPETVKIKGASSVLNPISVISIPPEVLEVTDATGNIETAVDIKEYLPDGVELMDNADAMVSVVVEIEEYQTRNFVLTTDNISVMGLNDLYELVFTQPEMNIRISGLQSDLDTLMESGLKASLDATALEPGTLSVEIALGLDDTVYYVDTVSAIVQVKEIVPEEIPGGDGTGDNTTGDGTGDGSADGGAAGNDSAQENQSGDGNSENTENGNSENSNDGSNNNGQEGDLANGESTETSGEIETGE